MTVYLHDRRPVHQARKYDPALQESSADQLEGWIQGEVPGAQVTATVDSQGFSITTVTVIDGSKTIAGVPGDWIMVPHGGGSPIALADDDIQRYYEVALVAPTS